MRAWWDFGGLAAGTGAVIAADVLGQLAELPHLAPWVNLGGLGVLAGVLLGLLYREQQRNQKLADAAADERQKAAERYDHLVELVREARCQECSLREGGKCE